ncbi:MAG: PSD1 and planctomycete cytochrome C domain-containing protein, partial [Phycisphaeraceae bacterium]
MSVTWSAALGLLVLLGAFGLGQLDAAKADAEAGIADDLPETVDYARDIRPILSENCFTCHGPDEQTREGGLRLDLRQEAIKPATSGFAAIVPGDVEESELTHRILADHEIDIMPPPDANRELNERDKQLLIRWIEEGAEYAPHWAFEPPVQAELPEVSDPAWPRNPIDHFVLAELDEQGLSPSSEADRYTLVRRLYLDLIGLPPTPEQADAFVNDTDPNAYTRLVDELLDSPHYGERWARRWLDLARYADTNGYEKDLPREMWPWRDWVIDAINDDMPFDQFTIEQLAGDLLPNASVDQIIATGFHRNSMINEEGGIDVEEYRYHAQVDRVGTTGTVFLGMTLACAQCHTHKYDPITQREYFQIMAIFDNVDEVDPFEIPVPELVEQREAIDQQIERVHADLANRFPLPDGADVEGLDAEQVAELRAEHLEESLQAWVDGLEPQAVAWHKLTPSVYESTTHASMTLLDDASVLVHGDKPNNDTYIVELESDRVDMRAMKLETLTHESLPKGGPGRAHMFKPGDFILTDFRVEVAPADKPEAWREVEVADASATHAAGNHPISAAIDGERDNGWMVGGQVGRSHHAVFNFAEPIGFEGGTRIRVTLLQNMIHQVVIGRFRLSLTEDARPVVAVDVPAEVEAALATPAADRTDSQRRTLLTHFLSIAPQLKAEHEAIAKLESSKPDLPTTLVMQEREPRFRRTTKIRKRGEFLQPTDAVEPGVPAVLNDWPEGEPLNRLGFARWLVADSNPLLARVTVNRNWAAFFGEGFVRTLEDFGFQGALPTHPELLDWLAVAFRTQGWSRKQLHRLIVTSATYRQDSKLRDDLAYSDPENRLLARGPRVRLEAELIRDNALAISGLLTREIGGPSVFPPQPDGVGALSWGGFHWRTATDAQRFRRGIYTYAKRTNPYAMASLFDAPSGEACFPQREVSNTPLRALTLLNDIVFTEAAQAMGRAAVA